MTEDEARSWLGALHPPGQIAKLNRFVVLLRSEAERQSLIARSTFDHIWSRHIVDSAQLLLHAPAVGTWLDVGSGGGLPGIVIAILRNAAIVLCEPRRKRHEFLVSMVNELDLGNVSVNNRKAQDQTVSPTVVSARAVSSMTDIFQWVGSNVSRETLFVLQRGRNWQEDMALTKRAWHGVFHVEQSITDPDARVILAHDVSRR